MDSQSWECLGLGELGYFGIVYIWNLPDLWSQKKHPHVGKSSELFTVGIFFSSSPSTFSSSWMEKKCASD